MSEVRQPEPKYGYRGESRDKDEVTIHINLDGKKLLENIIKGLDQDPVFQLGQDPVFQVRYIDERSR